MKKKTYSAEYFQQQGAKGGKTAAQNLTPAQRSARALKGSQAAAVKRAAKKKAKG